MMKDRKLNIAGGVLKLNAIKGSIAHWARMAKDPGKCRLEGEIPGWGTCPLCQMYAGDSRTESEMCQGCPIAEHTGKSRCLSTPYLDAAYAWIKLNRKSRGSWGPFKKAAQKEVDFLNEVLMEQEEIYNRLKEAKKRLRKV